MLYKRGFSLPYLRSVEEDEAKYILEEIHEGIRGNHSGARFLISKITRVGYLWPMTQKEARDFIKRCDKCQRYRNIQRVPREKMIVVTSLWPFT